MTHFGQIELHVFRQAQQSNSFYAFRQFHRRTFLQLFSQKSRTVFLMYTQRKYHFNVRVICKYGLQNDVFIRTTVFLVNCCTYLENFQFVWKTTLMYLYLFCKGINKLFTKLHLILCSVWRLQILVSRSRIYWNPHSHFLCSLRGKISRSASSSRQFYQSQLLMQPAFISISNAAHAKYELSQAPLLNDEKSL